MPRFNAEQIPNALQEQIRQEMLKKLMFDEAPLTEHRDKSFRGRSLSDPFGRDNPGPYDPVYRMENYNDTKTMGQSAREDQELSEGMRASRMQRIRPEQYNDPGSGNPLTNLPPASTFGFPPGSPMQEAYERMPEAGPPRYPMQVMPQGSAELQQLMQFYTDENI